MQASNVPSRSGSRWTAEYSGWLLTSGNGRWACSASTCAGGVVGHADLADLALVAERGQRGGDVGRVGEHVRPVDLVEVDDVDAGAGAASLARRPQRRPADESYGTGGRMPPLVASTIRSRSAGRGGEHPAEQLLARSPNPVPPQSRPYTSAVSTG